MSRSEYVNRYLEQTKTESTKKSNPQWLRDFFAIFFSELKTRSKSASSGDKYVITNSFREAFINELIPKELECEKEVKLERFLDYKKINSPDLKELLAEKRVDFFLTKSQEEMGQAILIEFKSNIQFNDFGSAMTEMAALKRFLKKEDQSRITTASLHLFPYKANVAGLKSLNQELWSFPPLDFIWVLCTPELTFDKKEIRNLRKQLANI